MPADASIDALVRRAATRWPATAGIVAGVLRDGAPSFHGVRLGDTALLEIGSITKPFTGVLLAEMASRGEVALDDPVTAYLPDDRLPQWKERPPTLEELATHRAALPNAPRALNRRELAFGLGLRSGDPWAGIDEAAYHALVRDTTARRPPGGRFAYSSLGFGLLGDALAARAGLPYGELLHDRVCAPLGLDDTWTEVPPEHRTRLAEGHTRRGRPRPSLHDHMDGAGAIRTTARDLLGFLACALAPPETSAAAALRSSIEPRRDLGKRMAIGLGWMCLRRKGRPELVWHSGRTWGFRAFAALAPEHGVAVVVLGNSTRSVDRLGLRLVERCTPSLPPG